MNDCAKTSLFSVKQLIILDVLESIIIAPLLIPAVMYCSFGDHSWHHIEPLRNLVDCRAYKSLLYNFNSPVRPPPRIVALFILNLLARVSLLKYSLILTSKRRKYLFQIWDYIVQSWSVGHRRLTYGLIAINGTYRTWFCGAPSIDKKIIISPLELIHPSAGC